MIYDDTDKALASTIEAAIKDANVNGIAGYTTSAMTEPQYNAAGGIGQSINRDTAIAIVAALRQQPMRMLVCSRSNLPLAIEGGVIYVKDGAAGAACLAFSDGAQWRRCDTLAVVG